MLVGRMQLVFSSEHLLNIWYHKTKWHKHGILTIKLVECSTN